MSEVEEKGKHEAGWVTISTDEYESMKSTLEILSDDEMRKSALTGKKQAKEGKTISLEQLKKELGY